MDDIVGTWTPPQQKLAAALRRLVRRTIPTSYERAYPGWGAVGFRDPAAGYFCGIFPVPHGLDLVFERGATLDDPAGLFASRPRLRQVRVVEVTSLLALRRPELRALLHEAVLRGSTRGRRR